MSHAAFAIEMLARLPELNFRGHLSFAFATAWSLAAILKMALSVGFRIPVSLLILLPKLRGSDSYPRGTDSHRTRQPSLDAQRQI